MVNDKYDFDVASAMLERKAYAELQEYALRYANAGDSNAQCLVAFLNQCGTGVPLDLDEAERWLGKAAEQNNPVAWNNLGTLWKTRGEDEKSNRCYQKATELGFVAATHLAKKS
jgi:TPR repeat protein